jgi:hypothetical protein
MAALPCEEMHHAWQPHLVASAPRQPLSSIHFGKENILNYSTDLTDAQWQMETDRNGASEF